MDQDSNQKSEIQKAGRHMAIFAYGPALPLLPNRLPGSSLLDYLRGLLFIRKEKHNYYLDSYYNFPPRGSYPLLFFL